MAEAQGRVSRGPGGLRPRLGSSRRQRGGLCTGLWPVRPGLGPLLLSGAQVTQSVPHNTHCSLKGTQAPHVDTIVSVMANTLHPPPPC